MPSDPSVGQKQKQGELTKPSKAAVIAAISAVIMVLVILRSQYSSKMSAVLLAGLKICHQWIQKANAAILSSPLALLPDVLPLVPVPDQISRKMDVIIALKAMIGAVSEQPSQEKQLYYMLSVVSAMSELFEVIPNNMLPELPPAVRKIKENLKSLLSIYVATQAADPNGEVSSMTMLEFSGTFAEISKLLDQLPENVKALLRTSSQMKLFLELHKEPDVVAKVNAMLTLRGMFTADPSRSEGVEVNTSASPRLMMGESEKDS